jgi:peroxiredoxin
MKSQEKMRVIALTAAIMAAVGTGRAEADAGQTLANYQLTSLDGAATTLAAYRGQVLVVNFWATWCEPCRKELPMLDGWNSAWRGRGARVVAISIDTEARHARRFAEDEKLTLTVLHDGPDGLARELDLSAIPSTFLVDRDGHVLAVVRGSSAQDLAALRRRVESMLDAGRPAVQNAGMGEAPAADAHDDGGSR